MLEPRVSKREKKLHLTYELPHRIHCSQIHPTPAPNGATLVFYGHGGGIRVLWRGGRRRRRRASPPQPNGVAQDPDVIVIDDGEDEHVDEAKQEEADEYEDEEGEQDPDCPFAGITHARDIELDSAALHLAVPPTPASQTPSLMRTHALVAVACADGVVKLLAVSLAPPEDNDDASSGLTVVELPRLIHPARCLAAKILPQDEDEQTRTRSKSRAAKAEAEILIATVSSTLTVCAVDLTATGIKKRRTPSICSVNLSAIGSTVSFHPAPGSAQLLVADARGAVRLFDPFGGIPPQGDRHGGKWIMSFPTPYFAPPTSNALLPRRKRILNAAWLLQGRGILVLLEDGEWGVWDVTGSTQSDKPLGDFAIGGFFAATAAEIAESTRSKKSSKLAPMTPNTRKVKSDNLFGPSSKAAGGLSTGGISTSTGPSKSGQPDESVLLWYGGDVYAISSMQQFWQRSTNNSGNFGALYTPGITHVSDLDLMNENVTSISQLPSHAQSNAFGQMNTQRDLVVSAEHRLIITQTLRSAAPTRQLFQQAAERPVSRDRDQRMLDAGDLDLGGLNRMLDSVAEDTRPRKVGFAR